MDDKKTQELVQECIKLTNETEDTLQCPLCMEVKETVVQCTVGHHMCEQCRRKIGNSCPFCKATFAGTKCFLVSDISKKLSNVKITLKDLDKAVKIPSDKNDKYRALIKVLLTRMSTFLNKSSTTLTFFNKYLQNPNHSDKAELERQLMSLTSHLHNVKYFLNDTEHNLKSLKK